MLLEQIEFNKKLPIDQDYQKEKEEIEFYRLSYEASGTDYTMGTCPDGDIIPKFDCEEYTDAQNRRKLTPTRSYVSSILQKYASSVFRNEPSRNTQSDLYEQMLKDADGNGNSLNEFMRKALEASQVDGESYIYLYDSQTDTPIMTEAQRDSADIRPYFSLIKKDSVLSVVESDKRILEVIFLLEDAQGNKYAKYLNDAIMLDISIDKELRVTDISEEMFHGFSKIPFSELEPMEEPQSKTISYSQRTIVNLLSLLHQELADHTFTKHVLSGVRLPQEEDGTPSKITYGSKRMIVLESETAKLSTIGSDVAQADSLRKQIELEEHNLYYTAGFGRSNLADTQTNVSGYSLEIQKEDFFLIANTLRVACEESENYLMTLVAEKEGFDYAPVSYSTRYVADDSGAELSKLRDALSLNLPSRFKQLLILDYIQKFYNISEADRDIIERELLNQVTA